ncbi:hypothetical protein C1646_766273 [Rhizophagus diaphanus]|nr:hypothetical protein C1646_766273 [Rhizophagus diaphanus] [Rhizophagus sp. MUCL 43196]
MVRYQCQICKKEFSTYGSLKQHANGKYHGKMRSSQLNKSPSEERVEANFKELEAKSELVNFEDTEFIDPKDLQDVSLNDAIDVVDGKPTSKRVIK